jgi:molecular chaperone GrpE
MSEQTETDAPANDVGAAAAAPGSPEALMREAAERIKALEAERDDFKDKWIRAEAEISNVRARGRREAEDARQFAAQSFARDVVEVAENMRRGLSSLPPPQPGEPETLTRLRDGFEGIERSFLATLERNGIVRQDPTGQQFDANLHQAMGEQPTAEAAPGTVLQAWTSAWLLNGRLLKPAMVVVAKPPEGAAGTAPGLDTTA